MTAPPAHHILPGEWWVSATPCRISTILGSCVAVTLFNHQLHIGGMNHFQLARFAEAGSGISPDDHPGRFGETSIPVLIDEMLAFDPNGGHLEAKIFGGGAVVTGMTDTSIGDGNTAIARTILAEYGIPIINECVGRSHGLKVIFETFTHRVFVKPISSVNTGY